nr:unnamed protein product [Callosobruchus analis]
MSRDESFSWSGMFKFMKMGQHPSKDKLSRSSSERIDRRERFGSFGKKEELGYRKVCARWVPRLLTAEQKLNRLQVCERLLARFREEGDPFLTHIITCDETWVHHYTPESKQASMDWREKKENQDQ